MQHNYVNMQLIYVNMQHSHVLSMQHIIVSTVKLHVILIKLHVDIHVVSLNCLYRGQEYATVSITHYIYVKDISRKLYIL